MDIHTVTVLGANGNVGAQCAAIIAGFGNAKVFMLSRSKNKSLQGIEKACQSIRSDSIKDQLVAGSYSEDLEIALKESDLVLETVAEDYGIKNGINKMISSVPKSGRIVSTVTSGLSINKLSESLSKEDQKNYFGIHFFNPPYKMLLCELIPNLNADKKVLSYLKGYLEKNLLRKVVITKDTPAFIANRIGFQFLNETAQYAKNYSKGEGISYMDYILGSYTGRTMAPLDTVNYVGLDVHKAIIDNIYKNTNDEAHDTFKLPSFMKSLIRENKLGIKTKQGLYKYEDGKVLAYNIQKKDYAGSSTLNFKVINEIQDKIRYGLYKDAFDILLKSDDIIANTIKHFITRYISYSFHLVGDVVNRYQDIDTAMSYGFGWAPPSCYIELLGGIKETNRLIEKMGMSVPNSLKKNIHFKPEIDYRQFFRL